MSVYLDLVQRGPKYIKDKIESSHSKKPGLHALEVLYFNLLKEKCRVANAPNKGYRPVRINTTDPGYSDVYKIYYAEFDDIINHIQSEEFLKVIEEHSNTISHMIQGYIRADFLNKSLDSIDDGVYPQLISMLEMYPCVTDYMETVGKILNIKSLSALEFMKTILSDPMFFLINDHYELLV